MPEHLELHGVTRSTARTPLAPGFVERELRFRWVERNERSYNEDMTCEQRGTRGLRAVMTHSDFGESYSLLSDDSDPQDVLDEILTCMGDVLADMRHLLDSMPGDGEESWQDALGKCDMHYRAERSEEREAREETARMEEEDAR